MSLQFQCDRESHQDDFLTLFCRLMHCHIGWHVAMGFALQIIEGISDIAGTVSNRKQLDDTCSSWATYATDFGIHTDDSGV